MKKTILFTAILAVGLNLTSCEDFLSEDNPNKIPVENYFTTMNVFITIEQPKLIRNIRV